MKRTADERRRHQLESLHRAQTGTPNTNDQLVIQEFAARGIAASPRVDVFTYAAWLALGRQVRRGERSVCVTTWVPIQTKETPPRQRMIPRRAYVFHISQTDLTA
jgi:hypothetical protein